MSKGTHVEDTTTTNTPEDTSTEDTSTTTTTTDATTTTTTDSKVKAGPHLIGAKVVDGKLVGGTVVPVNMPNHTRKEGEKISNLPFVAKRLTVELRPDTPDKEYSEQTVRRLVAEGQLGLWFENAGDDDEPIPMWFVADGKKGRTDTVADYIARVRAGDVFTRTSGGSVTVSKLPDTLTVPEGYTVPEGSTLRDVLTAFCTANNLKFTDRGTKAATTTTDATTTTTDATTPEDTSTEEAPEDTTTK
jgi:hypothetical protein